MGVSFNTLNSCINVFSRGNFMRFLDKQNI